VSDNPVDPLEETRAESNRPVKLVAGAPIGGYHLLSVLGEGGMGVVWSAQDPLLDRMIAIKVLKSGDAPPALRLRLLREARAMARLKHPNVLTVYEVGTEGERDFIAMELVEGGPLDDWLARDPPRADVIAALLAAGRGLAAAHAAGLVHRDFKPNNVLRSKDGRVLVTDFGLARGLTDDSPALAPSTPPTSALDVTMDATVSGRRADSVLDSPLTKTGALIGTPAYMAPEQYAGALPDPRTDQFAFCVTAWQALTGVRPFHGRTLEELRTAVSGGVAQVVSELPKPLRHVLARGLDPDPAKRWPDLGSLLEALEHAAKVRTRRWPLAVGAGVVAVGIALAAVFAGRSEPAAAATCAPAQDVFADADGKLHVPDEHPRLAAVFAEHRRRWFAEYEQTCKEPRPSRARVDCLRALRDRTLAMTELLQTRDAFATFDASLLLPHPGSCAARTPATPPAIPDEAPRRDRIFGVIASSLALGESNAIAKTAASLEAEAKATGWQPLVPMVLVAAGREYIRRGDIGRAREVLARAVRATETGDNRLAALARLAQLEASLVELEHPAEYATTKPDAMHEEISRSLTYARSAVKLAGDEPVLAGGLALLEAKALADLARRSPRKLAHNDALARVAEARRQLEAAGDLNALADAAAVEASIVLARADERALEDASFAARSAAKALEDAKLPHSRKLDQIRARIAFARGDLEETHQLLDRNAPPQAPSSALIRSGIVLGADGKPAVGATVVAWTGELHGDHRRPYTDRRAFDGDVVETSADGTFAIRVKPTAAIVAQHGELRSAPQVIAGTGTITLRVGPTTEMTGKVEARSAPGVDAFARFSAGRATWFLHAPIEDLAFRLRRIPAGAPLFGTIGAAGMATRRITAANASKLSWPGGPVVDVIARAPAFEDTATVWMFRERPRVRLRADAEALAATSTDVFVAPLRRIGSQTTDAGRALYSASDRHAVIAGSFDVGSVCVATSASPASPVTCVDLDQQPAMVVEVR
jgi:predicted Ser/Thr protein kinase